MVMIIWDVCLLSYAVEEFGCLRDRDLRLSFFS